MPIREKGAKKLRYNSRGGGRSKSLQMLVNEKRYDFVKQLAKNRDCSVSDIINEAMEKQYPALSKQ